MPFKTDKEFEWNLRKVDAIKKNFDAFGRKEEMVRVESTSEKTPEDFNLVEVNVEGPRNFGLLSPISQIWTRG